jgi:hypothetical protein
MLGLAAACGRSAMGVQHPAVDGGASTDAQGLTDVQLPADAQFPSDSWLQKDAPLPPDLAPAFACAALQPLADGVLTPRHVAGALFAPDGSLLVLRVKGEAPPGIGVEDDLLLVRLPSGEVSPIISSIASAEWLQPGSTLLVKTVQQGRTDLVVVNSDGSGARTLGQSVCDHIAAPDGSRVYAIHDCDAHNTGTISVIDVASGASTRLASGAWIGTPTPARSTAVSPDGLWVAFLTSIPSFDTGWSDSVVVVAAADGRVESLASQPGAHHPAFVLDDLLLFTADSSYRIGDIRGHVPGTGDTSYLVAANRDPGLFGFQVSPDKTWVLGATEITGYVDELYAIRVDGTGEMLLASNIYDYLMDQLARRAFAFSAGGHVLYSYDTGHYLGVESVGLNGSAPTVLSQNASFLQTPRLDQAVLVEPEFATSGTSHLRQVDLASGTDILSYASDGAIGAVGFPPSHNGLLFVEYRSPDSTRLRYASADQSLVLGDWSASQFLPTPFSDYYGTLPYIYPIDPTGCFTVFDTDGTSGPGTRLAILPQ